MKIKEQTIIPVIIGADINAYTLARTFHEQYNTIALVVSRYLWGPSNHSRIIKNIIEPELEDPKVLLKTLVQLGEEYKGSSLILLGCGDWYLKEITYLKPKLLKYYTIPYPDYELRERIVQKDSFYQICAELEIDYPLTYIYDIKSEEPINLPFGYPIAVKAADSASYHYAKFRGKQKGYKFYHKKELEQFIQDLKTSSYQGRIIIQDYIPGPDSNMYVLTCYSNQAGKVVFYALGHVLLEEHTPGAIGNYTAIINEVNHDIFKQARKFLEHVNYHGFSNFDVKYDPRDGKYKFFEINTRLGRSNYYVTGSGYNVAKFIVEDQLYQKELKPIIATQENLYLAVPKRLLFHYLKDEVLKDKAKKLIKLGAVCNPLRYKKDLNLKRRFYIRASLFNQYRKYYKYYHQEVILPPKYVGVIGGLGPAATVYFMDMVVKMTEAKRDQDHVNMIILNHVSIPNRNQYLLYPSNESPLPALIKDAQQLEKLGVSFIVIPCNTSFVFYQEIQAAVKVPVLNLIEITILYALKQNPKLKRIGLLATRGTIKYQIYEKMMHKYGIECILPTTKEQASVDDLIFKEVKAGAKVNEDAYMKLLKKLESKGAEKIILGCTELALIEKKIGYKNELVVDSLTVLALETIRLSGKTIKEKEE